MAWEDLRQSYLAILNSEGFRPEVDSDGDVHFKYEGGNYFVTSNCDDGYFQLLFPNFWRIESGEELAKVVLAASTATRGTKDAKVWVNASLDNVSASAESLINSPADVRHFLGRSLRVIRRAVDTFVEEMRGSS